MPERRFKIVWSREAEDDVARLASWLVFESPENAIAVLARLRRRAESLASHPGRGRVVPELAFSGIAHLREVVERPHRIVYRIAERTVFILGVFDGRRELEDVLLERLTTEPEP
jgi:plasmid stabilization system protein ParE